MDEIETRIGTFGKWTPIKWYFIVLAITTLLFLPQLAKAEVTFNETFLFSGGGTNTETLTNNGTSTGCCTTGVTNVGIVQQLFNDFNTQKTVTTYTFPNTVFYSAGVLTISLTAGATGLNTKFTPFTSTVEGINFGSGQIGWQRTTGNNFKYVISFESVDASYASTLVGRHEIVMTYNSSEVFTNTYMSSTSGGAGDTGRDCSYTYFIPYVIAQTRAGNYGKACAGNSAQQVSFSFTDQSTLSFNNISTNFGYVNLSKNGFNQELNITNTSGYIYYDVTSASDASVLTQKNTGIIAHTKDVISGVWANRTLVNADGSIPTPAPTQSIPSGGTVNPAPTIPASGGEIQFNQTQYSRGDQGLVQWAISNTEFDCTILCNSFYYVRFNPSGTIVENVPINTQTGDNPFIAQKSDVGAIKVELWEYNFLTNGFPGSRIDTGTSNVIENPTLILTSGSVQAQINFTIQVKYGYSANLTPTNFFIMTERLDNIQGFLRERVFNSDQVVTAGTLYPHSIFVDEAGTYRISIIDPTAGSNGNPQGIISSTTITSTAVVIIPPSPNITTSLLTTDASSYFLGQTINLNYVIDSLNFSGNGNTALGLSNQGFGKFIQIVNIDNGMVINEAITIYSQQGSMSIPIDNFGTITCSSNCLPESSIWFSGNISISLNVYNLTTRATVALAYANITLTSVNVDGYGIVPLTGSQLCLGQDYKFKVVVPGFINQSYIIVTYLDGQQQPQQMMQRFTNFTQSFTFHPIKTGEYEITLFDPNNNIQVTQIFFSKNCAGATPTTTPTSGTQKASEIADLISSNVFWALIIIAGLMIYIAWKTRSK